jgi:hypothetical protein
MNHAIEVLMMIGLELQERNRAWERKKGTRDVTWKHGRYRCPDSRP